MPKYKVYLDTSVVSALHDSQNPERQSLTEEFFHRANEFSVYVSELTLAEINATPAEALRQAMLASVAGFDVIEGSDEVRQIALSLVADGAIPEAYEEDGLHIAFAIAHGMDFLLSGNFKHIVRRRTKDAVRLLSSRRGYRYVEILSPPELL